MKQMSLIEMDGFLKGKCIPSDLKVNETNAEYLVRKFAEAEAKCAALAAENAGLKQSEREFNNFCRQEYYGWEDNFTETPATDAFLAEVRAQGVDAAIEAAKNLVAQEYEYKDFKAAQSDCCMHPGSDLVGKVEMTEWLVDFAAQLRKGGNQ
ncbi:hypothetical protein GNW43_27035 [Escherichia coli]|nr:hypothetical protein [Escherichia coli]